MALSSLQVCRARHQACGRERGIRGLLRLPFCRRLLRLSRPLWGILRRRFRLHVKHCLAAAEELSADPVESAQQCATVNDQVWDDFLIHLFHLIVIPVALVAVVCFLVVREQVELMSNVGKDAFARPWPAAPATFVGNRCLRQPVRQHVHESVMVRPEPIAFRIR